MKLNWKQKQTIVRLVFRAYIEYYMNKPTETNRLPTMIEKTHIFAYCKYQCKQDQFIFSLLRILCPTFRHVNVRVFIAVTVLVYIFALGLRKLHAKCFLCYGRLHLYVYQFSKFRTS